ncbi:MAG TPA: zinc finger Ran-binding domain-containing protein [Pyrinomonadaceae bacterium]|nr:zinc finger Ran-binding domain-containing protein [Pyrinomonadaceae bacterium]
MTGAVYILLAILFFVGAVIGFWRLDKIRPGGTVIGLIAFGLFVLSYFITPGDSRELNLVVGLFRITGIVGLIMGTISWVRNMKKTPEPNEPKTMPEASPKAQENPNKCPKCGLVNWVSASSCKRCGTPLSKE